MSITEPVAATARERRSAIGLEKIRSFYRKRRHDLPGIGALALLAALEIVFQNEIAISDQVNAQGPAVLTENRFEIDWSPGLAGMLLPFVLVAWLFGKRRPVRILFYIAVGFTLFTTVLNTISVLGSINTHHGVVGAATLLVNGAFMWIQSIVIFAIWYWSFDAGGPDLRGTPNAKAQGFLFAQQEGPIRGYEDWIPGFHDYLHASFVTSLTFHPGGAELLSARAKYMNMLQALVSVLILLLVVAKAVATFAAS